MLISGLLYTQTGGPGQPEFMQFQQAGTSDMVNLSSGSFNYQIPLFSIGGYPMNLTYQSGAQMEDVSSMVGLGWNLNAGSIVRTLRGLPDDFNGDPITKEFSIKPNTTYGGKVSADLEIAGLPLPLSLGADFGIFYNNYKGWGLEASLRGNLSYSNDNFGGSASLGLGIGANSQSGVDKYISPSISFRLGEKGNSLSTTLGKTWSVNTIEGSKSSLNTSLSYQRFAGEFSSRSYLNNSYQPNMDYPFENESGTYSGSIGWTSLYVDPGFRLSGYYSIQKLARTKSVFSAVGLMYETNTISGKTLMDFNKEKNLPYYYGASKILPIPYRTPDVFSLNAQGLSMTFSVMKNDLGIVGDSKMEVFSSGTQAGVEVNLGNLFKAGANIGTTTSEQYSQRWAPPPLTFKESQSVLNSDNLFNQYYFKNNGEVNKFDNSIYSKLWYNAPIRFSVQSETTLSPFLLSDQSLLQSSIFNEKQPVLQSTISYLTSKEASQFGFDKLLKYFDFNGNTHSVSRTESYRKDHHLSEISVTQPDGMKYIFGIPVYNITQKEVTFSVGTNVDAQTNLISYTPGSENSVNNNIDVDNFFEATTTPGYVTQFLITAILSPEYRDLTGDGISPDDIGNYVKFNYVKEDFDYKWRTPFGENSATYNSGLRGDNGDNKANYVYGEKELWYLHSIESKTEVSEFYYSPMGNSIAVRGDGIGVLNENGKLDENIKLRKLDRVKIYSLPDKRNNSTTAVPVKTITFGYDYSLCEKIKNSINSPSGKLTLKKVIITHENSKKGKHTPYEFEYGKISSVVDPINPDYNARDVNRWGYYQKNQTGAYSDCNFNTPLSNIDFPYSSQDKSEMDENAYAWNLTNITIPGEGKIEIKYEANDYSHVQDKVAGQMFMVKGVGSIGGNLLYSAINRIYFKVPSGTTFDELKNKYIRDIKDKYLYYKFYVDLKGGNNYEYITGYSEIVNYDLVGSDYAYIELESVDLDDERDNGTCSPILKSAIQFMRINRNKLIFNTAPGPEPTNLSSFSQSLPGIFSQLSSQIEASFTGVNAFCKDNNYCNTVNLEKSFIRLYNPTMKKISGGSRVREIRIYDNFDLMTGNVHENKYYSTEYEYTTESTDPVTNIKDVISSGIADYEPLIGGDEISLKQPVIYSDVKKGATDTEFYVEEPVNESLFPAPQITYGKVTQITNKTTEAVGKTGKIVNEFYTAKDFPVKVSRTTIDEKRDKTEYNAIQFPFVAIDQQHDIATVSQGYTIELNNMSGLPRSTKVYNEGGVLISGEEMDYFAPFGELQNHDITTIDRLGNIHDDTYLGMSIEYTVFGSKNYEKSVSNTFQANVNLALIGIFPIPIGMPLYSKMTEERQFQSIVINKVIHRNGILKSKKVFDQSSSVTTENLAFDEVTGEVLLTKTTNEFNDYLYSFKYPAYWMYDGMSPSYLNTGLKVDNANLSTTGQFLKIGDELRSDNGTRLWVNTLNPVSFLTENNGNISLPDESFQVYNSGARNLLNDKTGEIVTWNHNPLTSGDGNKISFDGIINSSAVEYTDNASFLCEPCYDLSTKNDYLSGKKGNWKTLKTWFYLGERTDGNISSGLTNIKEQGVFPSNYTNFWNPASSNWYQNQNSWEWKEILNIKDVRGNILETKDRLNRKNANLIGYNQTLITAQASNSAYLESYFEGFEDYRLTNCSTGYNNTYALKRVITNSLVTISNSESHTGKYSLEVNSPVSITIRTNPNCNDTNSIDTSRCLNLYPCTNKEYLFSCWVKVNKEQPILSNSDATVSINNGSSILIPEGPVIEGWQRIMGSFIANNSTIIKLNKGSETTYYDDLRITSIDGNMVSYVYDDVNYRLTNILDENNYFTKYEYNNQGELIRIKKETEKGILTIQEEYKSLYK